MNLIEAIAENIVGKLLNNKTSKGNPSDNTNTNNANYTDIPGNTSANTPDDTIPDNVTNQVKKKEIESDKSSDKEISKELMEEMINLVKEYQESKNNTNTEGENNTNTEGENNTNTETNDNNSKDDNVTKQVVSANKQSPDGQYDIQSLLNLISQQSSNGGVSTNIQKSVQVPKVVNKSKNPRQDFMDYSEKNPAKAFQYLNKNWDELKQVPIIKGEN